MSNSTNDDFASDDSGVIQFSEKGSIEDSAIFESSFEEIRSPELINVVSAFVESEAESPSTPERHNFEAEALAHHTPESNAKVETATHCTPESNNFKAEATTNTPLVSNDLENDAATHALPELDNSEMVFVQSNVITKPILETSTKAIDSLPVTLSEELEKLNLDDSLSKPEEINLKPKVLKDIIESSTPSKTRSRARTSDQVFESPYNTRLKAKLMKERSQSENTRKVSNN